jgi:tetratricopeptide (TPR) repeat protein
MAKRRNKKQETDDTLIDIVEVKESAESYFEKNKNLVLAVIGAIVIVLGGYLFYKFGIHGPKAQNAETAMYRAEQQFARDSFALALENPGGGFEGFLDIIDNYGGTDAANLASYYAGVSYLNLGKFEAAIEYLKDFSPAGNVTPAMKNGALGDAYSELGQYGDALSFYKKAADTNNDFLSPYYLKKYGLLSEKEGDNNAALNAYQEIKDKYYKSSEALDIDKYIARVRS